ncbi:MAG: type II toxin-antitoxin system VapC family toxin [Candidatus Limnocylindria bacterium]
MVRFWDSSAIVPMLVPEPSSATVRTVFESDPEVTVWWTTGVECSGALARLERESAISAPDMLDALDRLDALALSWREVQPVARLRPVAVRLLRTHSLRAADALQLAAARTASEDRPDTLPFVTLDERLALAAQREGFEVIRPAP